LSFTKNREVGRFGLTALSPRHVGGTTGFPDDNGFSLKFARNSSEGAACSCLPTRTPSAGTQTRSLSPGRRPEPEKPPHCSSNWALDGIRRRPHKMISLEGGFLARVRDREARRLFPVVTLVCSNNSRPPFPLQLNQNPRMIRTSAQMNTARITTTQTSQGIPARPGNRSFSITFIKFTCFLATFSRHTAP
jgi:hypothetical protein